MEAQLQPRSVEELQQHTSPVEHHFPAHARDDVVLLNADVTHVYPIVNNPVAIIVDGPYGIDNFTGDLPTIDELPRWYEPHIMMWTAIASPMTTLWFWGTELGWATVHPVLKGYGWKFRNCHIWHKGAGHIAGNANSSSLRKFPVVTEVCVQYVREAHITVAQGQKQGEVLSLKDWLRYEWERSGLPLSRANEACRVRNAATRKYLTKDHVWYFPPTEAFEGLVGYTNQYGRWDQAPYYSLDGERPLTGEEWGRMRAKFHCDVGITNVWNEPALRGVERVKTGWKAVHLNQKPLRLMEIIISSCTDKGDLVFEPFGGLCTGGIAAHKLGRRGISVEIVPDFFEESARRLQTYDRQT